MERFKIEDATDEKIEITDTDMDVLVIRIPAEIRQHAKRFISAYITGVTFGMERGARIAKEQMKRAIGLME